MTTVEQAAKRHIEKAYGFGFVYDHNEMVKCYVAGHATARAEIEAEIAALRAKLAEAEGKVPRWVRFSSEEWKSLVRNGWKLAIDSEDDPRKPHLLMVPPVPNPVQQEE